MPGLCLPRPARSTIETIAEDLKANRAVGVPYTDEMIAKREGRSRRAGDPDDAAADAFRKRYPNAAVREFDGDPKRVTELDALIAYLQMLGTLVDFKLYEDKAEVRTCGDLRDALAVRADRRPRLLRRSCSSPSSLYALWPQQPLAVRRGRPHAARGGLSRWPMPRTPTSTRSPASRPPATNGTASSELNKPLPRWWLYSLRHHRVVDRLLDRLSGLAARRRATPAALLGYSQREAVLDEVAAAKAAARRATARSSRRLPRRDPRRIPSLLSFALADRQGGVRRQLRRLPRPGARARRLSQPPGRRLALGRHARRHPPDDPVRRPLRPRRDAARRDAAFGRDGILKRDEIETVADYVLSLSGKASTRSSSLARRAARSSPQNCAACHGAARQGQPGAGRPQPDRRDLALRRHPQTVIATSPTAATA